MDKSKQKPVAKAPKKNPAKRVVYPHPSSATRAPHDAPPMPTSSAIRVVELFAGVGGFRVGLERANEAPQRRKSYEVIWSSQWEPSTKRQHASEVYEARFGKEGHSNEDIAKEVKAQVLPKKFDLLVGGFPCQDYSVARTLNQAVGIHGKKGVLWWEIRNILERHRPPYGLFENVDRLLKSPAKQRGRDFAVMLASLAQLGYQAEWRVINSAEYGFPQRRKRVFILVYRSNLPLAREAEQGKETWLTRTGTLAKALPCAPREGTVQRSYKLEGSLADITERFNRKGEIHSPFENAGLLVGETVHTMRAVPAHSGPRATLGSVLQEPHEVPERFYVPAAELPKWKYLKGAKSLERRKANGVVYSYDEGPIAFPDLLDRPSRTIVTGEGGSTPSRFKHLIQLPDGRWRRLTPIELERLNGFQDDHTYLSDITEAKRAFFMGNALVTGVVTRIGIELAERIT